MTAENPIFIPPAPDLLSRAVIHEGNKYFDYEGAFKQTVDILSPLMEVLSEPERISRSTTIANGER